MKDRGADHFVLSRMTPSAQAMFGDGRFRRRGTPGPAAVVICEELPRDLPHRRSNTGFSFASVSRS